LLGDVDKMLSIKNFIEETNLIKVLKKKGFKIKKFPSFIKDTCIIYGVRK
jgi:hypothetical protein